ncbi:MAG TPA: hypothetical protein VGQ83_38225, partial [Polyangia bacterium]
MLPQAILLTPSLDSAPAAAAPADPLLGGQTTVGRLLRTLAAAGVDEAIVVGPDDPRTALRAAGEDAGLELTFVEVPADTPDGLMLLCARPHVHGPALCLTTSHVVSRELLSSLQDLAPADGAVLAVDPNVARAPDCAGTLRVTLADERVRLLGRDLADFAALSTGVMITAPAVFAELARLDVPRIDVALGRLAHAGQLRAHDVGGALWQIVTSATARLQAEWMLRLFGDDLAAPAPSPAPRSGDAQRTLEHIRAVLAEKDARHYLLLNPGPV